MSVGVPQALHGALLPVVRQAVQHVAGVLLGAGVLSQDEVAVVAGLVLAVVNVGWMLVARAAAQPKP